MEQNLSELVNILLRSHKRWNEHVFQKRSDLTDKIIGFARETFWNMPPVPTKKQIRNFRKEMAKDTCCGKYCPNMDDLTDETLSDFLDSIGQPRKNGLPIAKSILYHRVLYQGHALFFVDSIVSWIRDFFRDYHVPDDKAAEITKYLVRSVIGHERRHRTQDVLPEIFDGMTSTEKERDAEQWEPCFMDWFGDTQPCIEREKGWREHARKNP